MNKIIKNTTYIVLLFLIIPRFAYAHGDMKLVYSFVSFSLFHFFCFIYIIISKYRKKFKIIAAPIFFILTIACYYYAFSQTTKMPFYIGICVVPTIIFFGIMIFRGQKVKIRSSR